MSTKSRLLLATLLLLLVPSAWARPKIAIQHWQTDNGVPVLFVARPQIPMMDVSVIFAAGSAQDGQHPGLAQLTHALLDQGTSTDNAQQIAEQFAALGAQLSGDCNRDMAIVSLRSLVDSTVRQKALKLFKAVITQASFPDNAFLRTKRITLQAIAHKQQSPNRLAKQLFYQTLYQHHPYGHPVIGTQESVSRLTAKQVKRFYKKYYTQQQATITIVGNVNTKQAKSIANTISLSLPKGQVVPTAKKAPQLTQQETAQTAYSSSQTSIFLGQVGINRHDPDYFALYVGNYILGGSSFTSRLFKQIRTNRGLSYFVYSYFLPLSQNGPFLISMQTRNNEAKQAIAIAQEVLDRFVKNGPTQAELKLAKQSITGSFPLRIASNSDIKAYLNVIGFYHLPLDYLDTFTHKINNLTREKITQAFQHQVKLQQLLTVTVGGKKKSA